MSHIVVFSGPNSPQLHINLNECEVFTARIFPFPSNVPNSILRTVEFTTHLYYHISGIHILAYVNRVSGRIVFACTIQPFSAAAWFRFNGYLIPDYLTNLAALLP